MFWIGLGFGLVAGCVVGMLALGLCVFGSDRRYDRYVAGQGTQGKGC